MGKWSIDRICLSRRNVSSKLTHWMDTQQRQRRHKGDRRNGSARSQRRSPNSPSARGLPPVIHQNTSQNKSKRSLKTSHSNTRFRNNQKTSLKITKQLWKQITKYKNYFLSSEWAVQSAEHLRSLCSKEICRFAASTLAIRTLSVGHKMNQTANLETNQNVRLTTKAKPVTKWQTVMKTNCKTCLHRNKKTNCKTCLHRNKKTNCKTCLHRNKKNKL